MSAQITLTRYAMPAVPINQHVWPLKVNAVSTIPGIPNEIFVYHTGVGGLPDRFEAVASVRSLSMYSTTPQSVGSSESIPFYRSDTATFDCLSADEATTLWQQIQDDVADLVANFNAKVAMTAAESITFS